MARLLTHHRRAVCLRLLVAVLVLAMPACTTVPPLAATVEPELLHESDERRELRQQRAAVPLEQRIAAIEDDLQRTLVPVGDGMLAPRYLTHAGRHGPLHVETNAAILSALAAKYAATGDEQAKDLAEDIIRGIMALDALSGELDGFIPFYADARTLRPSDHTTHSNVYTQLLFAYALAHTAFGPSAEIEQHVSLIYRKFIEDDFALRHVDGSYVRRADVNRPLMSFNARRTLDRRVLDVAAARLGDDETRELVRRHRFRGPLLGPMHARFFALELPTTSSSWLNLQAMTALTLLGEPHQRKAVSLANRYRRDDNPFFRLLAALNGADEDLADIRRRLAEFPYPATSSGIVNSHRDDLAIVTGRYVKFNAFAETRQPLPLYEIGSSTYLWKQRLLRIDSRPQERPQTLLGHDLYQAYWLLRMLERE